MVTAALEQAASALGEDAGPVVVQTGSVQGFWPAEEYHQKYLAKDPCGYCHVDLGDADRFVAEHQAEFGQAEQPASR